MMADACMSEAADLKLVNGLLTAVDCSITGIVKTGYGALMAPGSQLVVGLTALLTIYIAILGFRIMLGLGSLRVGDLTMVAVKIGVVLALATNWPLYHQLIFTTLFSGPEQFAGQLLGASGGKPVAALHGQLQLAFDEMQAGATYFAMRSAGSSSPWIGGAPFAAAAMNLSSVVMLVSTLGVLLGAKIVLAALLVAGPLFIGFLLFDSTQGIFAGWLRAALALALAPMMAMLGLVLQLTLIQPQLVRLAELRANPIPDPAPAIAVLVITLIVALVTGAGLVAATVIGFSLRLPSGATRSANSQGATARGGSVTDTLTVSAPQPSLLATQPRLASIAAATAALDRRDSRLIESVGGGRVDHGGGPASPHFALETAAPLGRTHRRSAQPSAAASSLRRDR